MTPARRKLITSRWHILQTHLEKMAVQFELDMLGANQISVVVNSSRDLNELIEWGFGAWEDVIASYQTRDSECRYFTVVFKPEKKGFNATEEEIEEEDES